MVQVECHVENELSRRVQDRLDLRYADEVEQTRLVTCTGLRAYCEDFRDQRRDLPALFWSLATDPRPAAQRIKDLLTHEMFTEGCQRLRDLEVPPAG